MLPKKAPINNNLDKLSSEQESVQFLPRMGEYFQLKMF